MGYDTNMDGKAYNSCIKKAFVSYRPMKRITNIFLILLYGCAMRPVSVPLATLPKGCTASGEIIRAELSQSARGYAYSYRVYLPPCFSADSESRYPVLYLIPGRGSGPDAWF